MRLPHALRELISPMSLAAYGAWLAVWLVAVAGTDASTTFGLVLRAALLLFLLLIMTEHLVVERLGRVGVLLVGTVLAVLALVATALTPQGASPILLVLLAALLASHLAWRVLLFAVAVVNVGLACTMFGFWRAPAGALLVWLLAYASFQMFAALVMRYAAQAEEAGVRLREANADLLATRELLSESARDAERLRMARELHDVAGNKLTALKLNLAVLARDPRFDDATQPGVCARLADELLADLRGLVQRMRNDEGLDLREALARLASPFPRPLVHVEIAPDAHALGLAQAEPVLRTVQEALTNAARHSQAANLWVVLRRDGGDLHLDIRDDGRGRVPLQPGNGLRGMRERLEAIGGELDVVRMDTGGVRVLARLPGVA